MNEKCTVRKGHKTKCAKVTKLADVHKARMQKAQNGDEQTDGANR
ncbi:hypothetical protein ACVXG7_04540 [Enterobacter hormaechei]